MTHRSANAKSPATASADSAKVSPGQVLPIIDAAMKRLVDHTIISASATNAFVYNSVCLPYSVYKILIEGAAVSCQGELVYPGTSALIGPLDIEAIKAEILNSAYLGALLGNPVRRVAYVTIEAQINGVRYLNVIALREPTETNLPAPASPNVFL